MIPINIIDVLTAAAPIVASIATIANSNKSDNNKKYEDTVCVQQPVQYKQEELPQPSININITNNFYTNSEKDSIEAAKVIEKQINDSLLQSGIRYLL